MSDNEEESVIPTDELVAKWKPALGQLWIVPSLTLPGREHRLLCGDCRDVKLQVRLHQGLRAALGLHDPPYGIDIVQGRGGRLGGGRREGNSIVKRGKFAPIEGDREPFDPRHLLKNAPPALVLWGANNYADRLPPSAEWIVWDKRDGFIIDNGFSEAELAWRCQPKNKAGHVRTVRHKWAGYHRASERGEKRLAPTQKPVAVQAQIVEWYSAAGDLVVDWYMGAGGVGLACEQLGRVFHGMDIAPAMLAATLERFERRGLKPRLAA